MRKFNLNLQINPIFIIGCPRSGTTIIGKFFEYNSKTYFFNEVNIWEENETLKIKLWQSIRKIIPATMFIRKIHWYTTQLLRSIRIMEEETSHRLTENDLTEEMIEQVKYILKRDLSSEKTLVIKSAVNSLRIPFIKKLFPQARFIHIIRDGRDVTCSLAKGNEGRAWMYLKPPNWQELQKKTKGFERGAWIWNTVVNYIREDSKKSNLN